MSLSENELREEAFKIIDGEAHVDLWYPSLPESKLKAVVVGLMAVRAADDIRITYDFDRDGWVIWQARWTAEGKGEWVEVGFHEAWALDETEGGE